MTYTIYVKLTNQCNLKCDHCYNQICPSLQQMDDNTLSSTSKWLHEFKSSVGKLDDIDGSLHGGEPMLYDPTKTLRFLDEVKDIGIRWTVTTNLVYEVTDKHVEVFRRMNPFGNAPLILTSFDYGDLRFKTRGQLELWERNVRNLIGMGIGVQPIVCLTSHVVSSVNPTDTFDYFKDLGIQRFNFERITNTGRARDTGIRPMNRDLDCWLLDAYVKCKESGLTCELFEGVERSVNGELIGCRARRCMRTVVTINPDGSISSCPNVADKTYGNVNSSEVDLEVRDRLVKQECNINPLCHMCKFFKQCNGDCCQLEFDSTGCPGMTKLYEHLSIM